MDYSDSNLLNCSITTYSNHIYNFNSSSVS